MNNNINEELKKEFLACIYEIDCTHALENENYLDTKKLADKLFEDFCDLSNNSILILDERETYILRKRLGFLDFGCKQTLENAGKKLGISASRTQQIYSCGIEKIRSYVSDAVRRANMSVLDYNIHEIEGEMSIPTGVALHRTGIYTLKKLVSKTSDELLKDKNFNSKILNEINKHLKKYNLSFADDIALNKKNITKHDVIKALIYKFGLDEKYYKLDEKYYKAIESMVDKLYDLKNNQILSLSSRETFIIRKMCGILDNGIKQSLIEINEDLHYEVCGQDVKNAFKSLRTNFFKECIYNRAMKLSREAVLSKNLKYFDIDRIDEEFYSALMEYGIHTLNDLIKYAKMVNRLAEERRNKCLYNILNYNQNLSQFLLDLVEEKKLTKEQLEEKKRKRREEQEKQEEERLEKIAFTEKRKNELLKARSVLLAQKEELVKRMRYYNNELNSVNEKIKKLENK